MNIFTGHHWMSKETDDKIYALSFISFVILLSLVLMWAAIDIISKYVVGFPEIPW